MLQSLSCSLDIKKLLKNILRNHLTKDIVYFVVDNLKSIFYLIESLTS